MKKNPIIPIVALHKKLEGKTQTAVASELGISLSYLSDILAGRRAIGPRVIKGLGLKKVVEFREA